MIGFLNSHLQHAKNELHSVSSNAETVHMSSESNSDDEQATTFEVASLKKLRTIKRSNDNIKNGNIMSSSNTHSELIGLTHDVSKMRDRLYHHYRIKITNASNDDHSSM